MFTLDEVKLKARRENDESNKRLHFFASHFSIYFSWIFINLRLSADMVTGIFFITGLCGAVLFSYSEPLFTIIAYGLWRLHVIFDICDGEVARFTQKFSINGAYWDYMIHSILYPLAYISICYSLFSKFNELLFLLIGMVGVIVVSQLLSVKNNYYRAMLFNKVSLEKPNEDSKKNIMKSNFFNFILNIINFEGFLLIYVVLLILDFNEAIFIMFLLFYTASFFAEVCAKFILLSKNGTYQKRS